MDGVRASIIDRMKIDLVGPSEQAEVFNDRPSDRYLTGILFPPRTMVGQEQDEDADTAVSDDSSGTGGDAISVSNATRPSSAGLSFAIRPGEEELAAITIELSCARYVVDERDDDTGPNSAQETVTNSVDEGPGKLSKDSWSRIPLSVTLSEIPLEPENIEDQDLGPYGIPGLSLHLRTSRWNDDVMITVAVSNANKLPKHPRRKDIEQASFFQVSLKIEPACGSQIIPKPAPVFPDSPDPDARAASLIYRQVTEYAVGHTCSAEWTVQKGTVGQVETSWIPSAFVPATSADGDPVFANLHSDNAYQPLDAKWISEADNLDLITGLEKVTKAYGDWIEIRVAELDGLPEQLRKQGQEHISLCEKALLRMQNGVKMIQDIPDVGAAFRLANRAMHLQHSWKEKSKAAKDRRELNWRPFQLAFALLTIASISDSDDADRGVMDLLWFPTGGGKTEAYLLIVAHAIFLRRLKSRGDKSGAGVTVFMRYTLRLLTVQQYQRAASLICACDQIRRGVVDSGCVSIPPHFSSDEPISLGLWVGQDSTPNKISDAIEALKKGSASSPAQVRFCPECGSDLEWKPSPEKDQIWACCKSSGCGLGQSGNHLPIWTVDEDVYRELPSLMIGTVDKYAQIARRRDAAFLFGLGVDRQPPDLVIQDELHLISGPLGTLAGVYEIAVDELCSHNGARPKVIGSTATIRRAEDQIRALFDRTAFQFPPPGLDHTNSGFAMNDPAAPGRIYVGVTTSGRSAKFTLQAVSASLLQAACDPKLSEAERDPYWTLVAYFNSLRELGGAVVLMQDDVTKSLLDYAGRRGEPPRNPDAQIELTSRVQSSEIPPLLDRLIQPSTSSECVDITLASNMISVGVDIPRLGLMIVNGQPKGIAEYIQATSRVGRGQVPGLIVSLYNANKARDRSHYETFQSWHQSLYRDVEATSVTPFAPRARDRALHAALVAMARHLIPGLEAEPVCAAGHEAELQKLVDLIVERATRIDFDEAQRVREYLESKVAEWIARGTLPKYWDDWRDQGLLLSAEKAAELSAASRNAGRAWPTPNSLRSVEGSVEFVLRPGLGIRTDTAE
jgi:hypothetical protein